MSGHSSTTCRRCLGSGCYHCNGRGQFRERVFRRVDTEAARLRAVLAVEKPKTMLRDEAQRIRETVMA